VSAVCSTGTNYVFYITARRWAFSSCYIHAQAAGSDSAGGKTNSVAVDWVYYGQFELRGGTIYEASIVSLIGSEHSKVEALPFGLHPKTDHIKPLTL
jgi:hypothetical protein